MASRSSYSRGQKSTLNHPFTCPPALGWFREPTTDWSPKSEDSDLSNSDEESHVAMETDYNDHEFVTDLKNKTFTLNAPKFPNSLVKLPSHSAPSRYTTSKSLTIGRPGKPVGLKDVDLTRNSRAENIRDAKHRNKGHNYSSIRQNSAPGTLNSSQFQGRGSQPEVLTNRSPDEKYFPIPCQSKSMNNDCFFDDAYVTKRRPRKYSKSPVLVSFSDEEDSDKKSKKNAKDKSQNRVQSFPSVDAKCRKESNLGIYIFTYICLAIALFAFYVNPNPHSLCLESEFTYNFTGLECVLNQEFFGQHVAKRVLLSSLKSHHQFNSKNKPLVLSLHGWTGTGKNYVTELIAKHLFKHGIQSKFVYKFIIPLHFAHLSEVSLYQQQLTEWITGNITKCSSKGGLFIFDEMDKIPPGIVTFLKPFLDPKGFSKSLSFKNVVFLFLSNSGGSLLNKYAIEHYSKGLSRENIELVQLESLLHRYAESNPTVWYNELLESEVIDHFVPFLPLERSHVKQCIRRDLKSKRLLEIDTMINEVANEMSYFPDKLELFSVSGCKKVSSKVDVAMG